VLAEQTTEMAGDGDDCKGSDLPPMPAMLHALLAGKGPNASEGSSFVELGEADGLAAMMGVLAEGLAWSLATAAVAPLAFRDM